MKSIITLCVFLTTATSAFAAPAYWTGQMEYIDTVTGKQAIRCEYDYFGTKFWRIFGRPTLNCPSRVEVE